MPVLVNAETGLAEDLPHELATQALAQNTHQLPFNDPEGNPVVVPHDQAADLLGQGYKQPSPEQLKSLLDYAKYSTPTEQIKTGLEGAASAATFGLSKGVERALGAKPEDIAGRAETNPGVYGLGEGAGLLGSAFIPGVGAANLLGRAGEAAAAGIGLGAEGAGLLSQVGSAAAKGAVENALFQTGGEAGKLLAGDPGQSMQSAITDIGLSAVLGAGLAAPFGAVPAIWRSAKESSLGNFLNTLKNKLDGSSMLEEAVAPAEGMGAPAPVAEGISGEAPSAEGVSGAAPAAESINKEPSGPSVETFGAPVNFGGLNEKELNHYAEMAGVELTPAMKAGLSSNPDARGLFQLLQQSPTKSAQKAQKELHEFLGKVNDSVLEGLGHTPDSVHTVKEFSPYNAGLQIQQSFVNDLKPKIEEISNKFDSYRNKFINEDINNAKKAAIADKINKLSQAKGYYLMPGSAEEGVVHRTIQGLSRVDDMEALRNLITRVNSQTQSPELWGVGKDLNSVLRDSEESLIESRLSEKHPELLEEYSKTRMEYRNLSNLIEDFDNRLRAGKYAGPKTFLKAVEEMKPEDVLKRLTPKNDAGLLDLVSKHLPTTNNLIKQNYLDSLIRPAIKTAKKNQDINLTTLFKDVSELTPEIKKYAIPDQTIKRIDAAKNLISSLPDNLNPSGTAKTLISLVSQHATGGALSLVSLLSGHNPLTGFLLGKLADYTAKEAPDAARLSLLKFLGSNQPVSAPAFKSMVDYTNHVIKGEALVSKATKAIFKAGQEVLPQSVMPSAQKRDKIDQKIKDLQSNAEPLMDVGGHIGHYLPEHGAAFGETAATATTYLNGLRPKTAPIAPLDPPSVPSKMAQSRYQRALDLAEQPLLAVKAIKDGNLTPQDVIDLKSMYPKLYEGLTQKLMTAMVDHLSAEKTIPYAQRLSLSLFLGQNLDSSMTPQSILAAQPKQAERAAQADQTQAKANPSKMNSLNKLAAQSQTPFQARAQQKTGVNV